MTDDNVTSGPRRFIGKAGKYQIPPGAIVALVKTFPRRRCLIAYEGREFLSFVTLLRKGLDT